MKPFLSVVMKPTLSCNAHCRHCYSHDDGSGVMDMSVVERTVGMVRAEYDSARYLWTGGEPLLAGERFFKRARACQKEAYGKAIGRCGNTIQTNGLLLTPRASAVILSCPIVNFISTGFLNGGILRLGFFSCCTDDVIL